MRMLPGCLGVVLDEVRRRLDDVSPWHTTSASEASDTITSDVTELHPVAPATDVSVDDTRPDAGPGDEAPRTSPAASPATSAARPAGERPGEGAPATDPPAANPEEPTGPWAESPGLATSPDQPLPPGPWRWRWMWPSPGRPGGMALVAADGTLLLWSPGGFAGHDALPDGRPTPEVALALAAVPDLAESAAAADELRSDLDRALATALEARQLLRRAAGAVDDAIDRRDPHDPGSAGH